jgi:hypothetical protein
VGKTNVGERLNETRTFRKGHGSSVSRNRSEDTIMKLSLSLRNFSFDYSVLNNSDKTKIQPLDDLRNCILTSWTACLMRNFVIDPPSEISGTSNWIVWGRRSEGRQVPKHLQHLHYKYGIKNTTDLAQKYPCFFI